MKLKLSGTFLISKEHNRNNKKLKKNKKKQTPVLVQCSLNGLAVKDTHTKEAELVCLLRNQVTTANPFAVLSCFNKSALN